MVNNFIERQTNVFNQQFVNIKIVVQYADELRQYHFQKFDTVCKAQFTAFQFVLFEFHFQQIVSVGKTGVYGVFHVVIRSPRFRERLSYFT